MNEIQLSETYEKAIKIHTQVMVAREQVSSGLVDLAKHLKEMRDGKLYKELGHDSFDDYVEQRVKIGIRQVYNYIATYEKLGETVLRSNENLGIEKLKLLASVPDLERAEFIEKNELEGMSTREIKELIQKSKDQEEQINILIEKNEELFKSQSEAEDNKDALEKMRKYADELYDEARHLKEELDNERKKPVDIAVAEPSKEDIEKIKAEAKAEFEKEKKQAVADETLKALTKAEKKHQKELAEAVSQAEKNATEKLKASLESAEKEKAELLEKAKKLAKELELKGDEDIVTFKASIDLLQGQFKKLFDVISGLDFEKQTKFKGALRTYVENYVLPQLGE